MINISIDVLLSLFCLRVRPTAFNHYSTDIRLILSFSYRNIASCGHCTLNTHFRVISSSTVVQFVYRFLGPVNIKSTNHSTGLTACRPERHFWVFGPVVVPTTDGTNKTVVQAEFALLHRVIPSGVKIIILQTPKYLYSKVYLIVNKC